MAVNQTSADDEEDAENQALMVIPKKIIDEESEYLCSVCGKNDGTLVACHQCPRILHPECHVPFVDVNNKR